MIRIFWKKTNKKIVDLTKEERRNVAADIVSESSQYFFSSSIDQDLIVTQKFLANANIDLLFQLHERWCEIYRKERKRLIEEDYYRSFNTIKKERKLVGDDIVKWKLESAYLFWLDEVIQTPLMDIYKEILAKRSSLNRLKKWTDELENIYREISFGKNQMQKEPYLVSLNLLIQEKIPIHSDDYEINLHNDEKSRASTEALEYLIQCYISGKASQIENFRRIFFQHFQINN